MTLPLTLSHCGYMVKEKDNNLIDRPSGSGNYLFLYFPVGIYLTADGTEQLLEKHACIFYAPQDPQYFRGCPVFLNTYVHFEADSAYMDSLRIAFSRPFYPDNYMTLNQLVSEMQQESISAEPHSDELADLALQKLLLLAARHFAIPANTPTEKQMARQRLEQLRLEMLTNCTYPWTVQELTVQSAMSRSQLYSCYREFFNASPKAELLNARLAKARQLLTNKALTVREVAHDCGFESLAHFSRYYKKHYGHPPRSR